MKIIKLEIQNVEKIKAATITPNGASVVPVGGWNGTGKTSALDSIQIALEGARAMPQRPIHDGADSAKIIMELDSLVVTKHLNADGSSELSIIDKVTGKSPGGQKFLDELTGRGIAFDPLAFMRMEPQKQLLLLKQLVGLDFTDLDARRKELYEERTDAGRDVTSRKNQIDALPEFPKAPATEVSVTVLAEELRKADAHNAQLQVLQAGVDTAAKEVQAAIEAQKKGVANIAVWRQRQLEADALATELGKQIVAADDQIVETPLMDTAEIERQIVELQAKLKAAYQHNQKVANAKAQREALLAKQTAAIETADSAAKQLEGWDKATIKYQGDITAAQQRHAAAVTGVEGFQGISTEPIKAQIANAQETNRQVLANQAKHQLRQQFNEHKARYDALTAQIDEIDREKARQLAAAKFPIEGLGFGLSGVLYKNLPLEQASGAEKLRVSTAIAIARFPERPDAIKILCARDASLLDPASVKLMEDMATEADAQIWLEIVTDDQSQALVIFEDGCVKGSN